MLQLQPKQQMQVQEFSAICRSDLWLIKLFSDQIDSVLLFMVRATIALCPCMLSCGQENRNIAEINPRHLNSSHFGLLGSPNLVGLYSKAHYA